MITPVVAVVSDAESFALEQPATLAAAIARTRIFAENLTSKNYYHDSALIVYVQTYICEPESG